MYNAGQGNLPLKSNNIYPLILIITGIYYRKISSWCAEFKDCKCDQVLSLYDKKPCCKSFFFLKVRKLIDIIILDSLMKLNFNDLWQNLGHCSSQHMKQTEKREKQMKTVKFITDFICLSKQMLLKMHNVYNQHII